ncbi:hypothetical protein ACP70R_048160 [Stipagrostis hirtigluma subsp. patula]
MSSPEPSAVPALHSRCGSAAVEGVLPRELLIEVMVLLPAKEVCRLRAVCPSWRSLTYDPLFLAAHAARRPGPLLAVLSSSLGIDLVDQSGDVVRRIRSTTGDHGVRVLCTRFDCVFVAGENHSVGVIEPISGSMVTLPGGIAEALSCPTGHPAWFAFGQVASTGEYKLVRVVEEGSETDPVCEVFTFGKGFAQWRKNKSPPAYHDEIGQWRTMECPPAYLDPSCTNGVVVNGAAYFLFDHWQLDEPYIHSYDMEPGCIPSLNLETEQWSVALQGPLSRILEEADGIHYRDLADRLMLGETNGCLVMSHCNDRTSTIDLWFFTDFENSVWSKQYKIPVEYIANDVAAIPLVVLDEGNIILFVRRGSYCVLQIYNPRTNGAKIVLGMYCSIFGGAGIYTGSLLL